MKFFVSFSHFFFFGQVNTVYQLKTFQLLCEHTIVHNINARSVIPILGVTYIKGFDTKV